MQLEYYISTKQTVLVICRSFAFLFLCQDVSGWRCEPGPEICIAIVRVITAYVIDNEGHSSTAMAQRAHLSGALRLVFS